VFEMVLSGGKLPSPSWKRETGSAMSFRRCSPRSTRDASTSAAVVHETTT